MKRRRPPPAIEVELLCIVRDLVQGGRHSRHTVVRATGRSLATADRWLKTIEVYVPGARRVKHGKVAWLEIHGPMSKAPPRADDANIDGERQSVRTGGGVPRASRTTTKGRRR